MPYSPAVSTSRGARGLTRPIIAGRRFVIHGLSRLTVRVARLLAEDMAEVVVVGEERHRDLARLLGDSAHVVWASGDPDRDLGEAGLLQAQGFLVLGEEDLDNLQAAVVGSAVAPAVPVVLRIFNPVLAEQFETRLNVRRAYSVSALAAPVFVAAALGEEVVQTMHLGDEEVALCRVVVNRGSPIAGETTAELESDYQLVLLARSGRDGSWEPAVGRERIAEGDQIMVGGPMIEVLRMAVRDHTLFGRRTERMRRAVRSRRPRGRPALRRRETLLPVAAAILGVVLLVSALVFAFSRGLNPIEAAYFTVTTAFGEQTLAREPQWLKVFGIVTAVAGGALAAVVFSHLASVATAVRLEERAGRRAQRLADHIVVAGLGTVGYRVVSLLCDLGIPAVAVERSPDSRFRDALGDRAPVLSGDVRLPENLERAGLAEAVCMMACTDDDLANVLACLHARRVNPRIRTVARVFDEDLAERVGGAFGVDVAISATEIAAGAFASAATDERAARPFDTGEVRHLVLREDFDEPLTREQVRDWEHQGLHLLAFRRGQGAVEPPSALVRPLETGDSAIMAGPENVVRTVLLAR
jgi:Trk K+ transport system NAD-binding subunit